MSNLRKDFDVKQILRIRWRWFGHPTSPPSPGNQPSGDLFSSSSGVSSRGTGGSSSGGDQPSLGGCSNSNAAAGASSSNGNSSSNINNNRKFGDSGPNSGHSAAAAVVSASACPRSMSQQECRSAPPAPWVFPAHSRSSDSLEPLLKQKQQQKQQSTLIKDPPAPGDEENNNNVESDSSSCRYGKHHWCGSSRAQQGACSELVPLHNRCIARCFLLRLKYVTKSPPFVSSHFLCVINSAYDIVKSNN